MSGRWKLTNGRLVRFAADEVEAGRMAYRWARATDRVVEVELPDGTPFGRVSVIDGAICLEALDGALEAVH